MSNPYFIQGPALISVSGGRTSGFMLRQIIDAHGGKLPHDVLAVFCNTGKEHESSLNFIHEIETRWTPIVWLEYSPGNVETARVPCVGDVQFERDFRIVHYCSASRNGEPFAAMISTMACLPNPIARNCTKQLKLNPMMWLADSIGWESHTQAVGLRYDEPHRARRIKGSRASIDIVCPMYEARHGLSDVLAFWKRQDFDLQLPGNDNAFGNCDLCFLKKRAKIEKVLRSDPNRGEWWARHEETKGMPFRVDRPTYRQMLTQLSVQGRLLDDAIEDDTLPCACTD